MIDIENELYTKVNTALQSGYSGISMASIPVRSPASFPHVQFEMISNETYEKTLDSSGTENYAEATFEVNIYATGNKRKGDSKKILQVIDTTLRGLGLVRTYYSPTPNMDESVYRITARYKCLASNTLIYRR